MRQKELRIALICYGGVSLAVYMHGVTKELWKLAKASRAFHSGETRSEGVQGVYRDLLQHIEQEKGLRLRVLPDILTGASAGGINAVFLAQAIHSGQSLEPLTDLWLDMADVDQLVDPDARPMWRFAKFWAQPIASWILRRPGNVVTESVAPETRDEVRRKVSHFVRGRWFEPPFSGSGFSKLLYDALAAMENAPLEQPLLPPGHPVDVFVTATDFHGHLELLRLNSPKIVEESEHRMPISFSASTPAEAGASLANLAELTFAARATASFPGAFPPLQIGEVDRLCERASIDWSSRERFVQRIMPVHSREGDVDNVALIDGSVLVNAPFGGAMDALKGRPAQREVDRRFVYIDPRPDRFGTETEQEQKPVGFFAAIFGSLSTIPREQPIRDNLEQLDQQSRDAEALRRMVTGLRPEVERAVERLFGRTLFLNKPTPKRLVAWRNKAQQAAAEYSGFAFSSYAQAKFTGIVDKLARLTFEAAPASGLPDATPIAASFFAELEKRGLSSLSDPDGGASQEAIAFFRAHDLGFRIRRLRLLARRLARDWEADPDIPDDALEAARKSIYEILALYFDQEKRGHADTEFAELAANVLQQPGAVLDYLAGKRLLPEVDEQAEIILSAAMQNMPKDLRRRMLLTYLGFPFYDVATLPLMRTEGLTEFDPIKVDRISPDDAKSIREGGTKATLRGTEFYNFGAFFSRTYRENDYLWGRLHGAERMIDLVCSTLENPLPEAACGRFKRQAFLAILDEEEDRLTADSSLLVTIRREVLEKLAQ
ncbi:patatin-like protein [Pontixanthobacter aestiaquae]|uniref:Patatin-like protein n=1 Tax=Pontixanthobacter aestiaquae TaxID=1509367 RepID=A0A844Z9P8_9SPHN|nr:patatin-like protein [Pontixanthobacter aestiaquae]MDN3645420.1 patatin-like protein [Pontixanthobacter aestiaquae]MXO83580.1 patatin-like protein [Pontixanthobacter aestiaquae]